MTLTQTDTANKNIGVNVCQQRFAPSLNLSIYCMLKAKENERVDNMKLIKKLAFLMLISWLIGLHYNGGIL